MADMTDLERRANQYITEQVSKGIRREDVLADWIRSDNADLQKYAKGILVKDLNPDQAAAEATGGGNPPGGQPAGSSYLSMAKDMAPILVPAALTSAAVATGAYYYGKKKGQGIAPLSDFEAKKQELELERMRLQNDVERARLTQMANKGQSLETQAKFSEPTAIEAAANTTSVKVPSPATVEAEISKVNPLGQSNMTLEDIERLRAAQQKAPAGSIAPGPAPELPISTPITAAPVDAPAPTPSAQPNSPVTSIVTDTVKEMIQETPAQPVEAGKPVAAPVAAPQPVAPPQDLVTGTGKPAFAGMGPEAAVNKKGQPKFKSEYADINAVPRGYAFVPGAQYIDTPRQNIGQAEYTKAFTNQPFPLTNELAIQQSKDINKMLGRATRAENIAAGLPPAELTPGITKKTSAGTKPVRVAGTVGALMAISDLAKAETPGQRGMAGANLLEAVLPPGMMMSGAGAGSDVLPNMSQAMLLGSPYAQTDIAKRFRQQQEYQRKVSRAVPPPMR